MGTGEGLQPARDEAVGSAGQEARDQRHRDGDDGGSVGQRDAGHDSTEGAHEELALGADVEETGLEAETDGESAQDVRRGTHERVDDAI